MGWLSKLGKSLGKSATPAIDEGVGNMNRAREMIQSGASREDILRETGLWIMDSAPSPMMRRLSPEMEALAGRLPDVDREALANLDTPMGRRMLEQRFRQEAMAQRPNQTLHGIGALGAGLGGSLAAGGLLSRWNPDSYT